MISELALTGPIAWVLIAVAPLVLIFAALLSLRSNGVRQGMAQGDARADVGDSTPSALARTDASRGVALGSSAPLVEGGDAPQRLANVAQRGRDFDGKDEDDCAVEGLENAPAAPVEEENRSNGTGSRLVNFPTIEAEVARVAKLDSVQVADAQVQIRELEARRSGDEGLGDDSERLALLYLQVGEALSTEGSSREGAELICKSLELSIPGKYDLLQAQGRMALGEIAVADGDFSGACEQWQMAAEMFRAAGFKDPSRAIGSHMHKCGCPTDWVLTDF